MRGPLIHSPLDPDVTAEVTDPSRCRQEGASTPSPTCSTNFGSRQRLKGHARLHTSRQPSKTSPFEDSTRAGQIRSLVLCLASGQWIRAGQTVPILSPPMTSRNSWVLGDGSHLSSSSGSPGRGCWSSMTWGLTSPQAQGRPVLLEVLDHRRARRGSWSPAGPRRALARCRRRPHLRRHHPRPSPQ